MAGDARPNPAIRMDVKWRVRQYSALPSHTSKKCLPSSTRPGPVIRASRFPPRTRRQLSRSGPRTAARGQFTDSSRRSSLRRQRSRVPRPGRPVHRGQRPARWHRIRAGHERGVRQRRRAASMGSSSARPARHLAVSSKPVAPGSRPGCHHVNQALHPACGGCGFLLGASLLVEVKQVPVRSQVGSLSVHGG
jgi:hypothetical protein